MDTSTMSPSGQTPDPGSSPTPVDGSTFFSLDIVLLSFAVFAFCWTIARAYVQAVTIDEANTYLFFVSRAQPFHWFPASNNHILNSALMRLAVDLCGVSNLSIRLPALLGAAVYIGATYTLCILLIRDTLLRWSVFLTLVYNPLIFDYLVAARGYGLALGFLMWILTILVYCNRQLSFGTLCHSLRLCAACSVLAGLSCSANFSFAFVNLAAMLVLAIIALFSQRVRANSMGYARNVLTFCLVCSLPAALVIIATSGYALVNWPAGQFTYGSSSLRGMMGSVLESSLYQVNEYLVNPLLYPLVRRVGRTLCVLLFFFGVCHLIILFVVRSAHRSRRNNWLLRCAAHISWIVCICITLHWTAFGLFSLLLPKDRTALYIAPLLTTVLGTIAATDIAHTRTGELVYRGFRVVFVGLACYFVLCLRLSYFKEWRWDADVQKVYSILSYYNHACALRNVGSSWHYSASLNFYRQASGHETLNEFVGMPPYTTDRDVYVLHGADEQQFIIDHHLKIIYRGEATDVVVAASPAASACVSGM